jgi:biotin carboxyl carrier protein
MASTRVLSPIAGTVIEVCKKNGDVVAVDDPLIIVECMKVHIPVPSPAAGRVGRLTVKDGDLIESDQLLCTIDG